MKLGMRVAVAALTALGLSAAAAIADWAPAGPITLKIAFRAGGGADIQARLIAEELEARHGWKIIPQEVAGKGGAQLAQELKNDPADGTVIGVMATETLGYNMIAARNANYALSDFTPLTTTAGFETGVVALTSKGWKTLGDVIEAAKGGAKIRFGAMSDKLADLAYLLGRANGVEFNIVMMAGGKAVMDGLNAGDIDVGWGAGIQTRAVLAGDMVNLASGLSTRLKSSPDAPLIGDYGVRFNADGFFVFVAPAGLPDAARTALADAIGAIVSDPASKAHQFLSTGFGGTVVIKAGALDTLLAREESDARALRAAVTQ